MARSALVPPCTSAADLAIVGAGPVGLYAGYYAGFRGLDTVLVEALPFVGGQIAAFYADAEIFDVPGFPRVRGRELVAALVRQADLAPDALRLGCEARAIERDGERFRVRLKPRRADRATEDVLARAVLVTAGIGPFAAQRIADPAIDRFEGRGLVYEGVDAESVDGRRALVLGGSALALDAALALAGRGADVALAHRRDRLSGGADSPATLAAAGVRFLPFRELEALEGDPAVHAAILVDRRSGERERIEVSLVVPRFGVAARGDVLHELGAGADGALAVDSRMATAEPGIWAAGDVASYPGKIKLLATAFGEACIAVNHVAHALLPGASVFPGYSSHGRGASRKRA